MTQSKQPSNRNNKKVTIRDGLACIGFPGGTMIADPVTLLPEKQQNIIKNVLQPVNPTLLAVILGDPNTNKQKVSDSSKPTVKDSLKTSAKKKVQINQEMEIKHNGFQRRHQTHAKASNGHNATVEFLKFLKRSIQLDEKNLR